MFLNIALIVIMVYSNIISPELITHFTIKDIFKRIDEINVVYIFPFSGIKSESIIR